MRIPFTKYGLKLEKRGIEYIDRRTNLPIAVDMFLNRFQLGRGTPILAGIYDTIASEFSKIDLMLVRNTVEKAEDGTAKHVYAVLEDNPNYGMLSLRPNMLQTKSELLYTIAYQLHAYRNALVKIIRAPGNSRNVVTAIEPLNVDDYLFGQGYEINGELYLKLKEKKTGKIVLLDYGDVIHLRLSPNDLFYGDKNEGFDLTHFVRLFDENLNVLFNSLKEAGKVEGVIEVGGSGLGGGFNSVLTKDENKISKQQEIINRIKATEGGVLVLDSGEKWVNIQRSFETMTTEEVNNIMKYLYNFKGINQAVIDGTATEAQMEVFFNKSIMPIIERFIEELNYKFLTSTARTQGQQIEYFKNPFEYMATKDLLANLYLGAMFFSQNEVRRMAFKLPPLPGGDVLIDNKNFTKAVKPKAAEGGEEDGENPAVS